MKGWIPSLQDLKGVQPGVWRGGTRTGRLVGRAVVGVLVHEPNLLLCLGPHPRRRRPVAVGDLLDLPSFGDGATSNADLLSDLRINFLTRLQIWSPFRFVIFAPRLRLAIETERAKERNSKTAGSDPSKETFPDTEKGQARDKAAEKVNASVSGRAWSRQNPACRPVAGPGERGP